MTVNTDQENLIYNVQYIYDKYKEVQSEIIAYIEVYDHDLPDVIVNEIVELFQIVAVYETSTDTEKINFQPLLREGSLKITQALHKYAICLLIKKIEEHKKLFKKFYYKGVWINEYKYKEVEIVSENFAEFAQNREKEIIHTFSDRLKRIYQKVFWKTLKELKLKAKLLYLIEFARNCIVPSFGFFSKNPLVQIDSVQIEFEEVELSDIYEDTKALLKLYEDIAPKVISSGAKKTLGFSVFSVVTGWIIPILLIIPVIKKLVEMFLG